MLTWKHIKQIIESDPVNPVNDNTVLSYVIVHGPQVGFGVVPENGVMSVQEYLIGGRDKKLRHVPRQHPASPELSKAPA